MWSVEGLVPIVFVLVVHPSQVAGGQRRETPFVRALGEPEQDLEVGGDVGGLAEGEEVGGELKDVGVGAADLIGAEVPLVPRKKREIRRSMFFPWTRAICSPLVVFPHDFQLLPHFERV